MSLFNPRCSIYIIVAIIAARRWYVLNLLVCFLYIFLLSWYWAYKWSKALSLQSIAPCIFIRTTVSVCTIDWLYALLCKRLLSKGGATARRLGGTMTRTIWSRLFPCNAHRHNVKCWKVCGGPVPPPPSPVPLPMVLCSVIIGPQCILCCGLAQIGTYMITITITLDWQGRRFLG